MANVFIKHHSCPIVKGYQRDAIYDLDRNTFNLIPKALTRFVNRINGKTKYEIKRIISHTKQPNIYEEYYQFILNNEYGFFCNALDFKNFIQYSTENFSIPYYLKSIVIEYNKSLDYTMLIAKADEYQIPSIGFDISKCKLSEVSIEGMYNLLLGKSFYNIYFKISTDLMEFIEAITKAFNADFYFNINFYLPTSQQVDFISSKYKGFSFFHFSNKKIEPAKDFIINYEYFFESKNFNLFYNKKIFVNTEGVIAAAPDATFDISNLRNENFNFESLLNKDYEPWNISKEKIEVCKNCEFRRMCCTSKIPVKKEGKWVYQEKCNYNPYDTTWEN